MPDIDDKVETVVVTEIEWLQDDCVKVASSLGSFFIRLAYLERLALAPDISLCAEEVDDMLNAASAFAAERSAMEYLSRSEQCRFLLAQKLKRKGFSGYALEKALDYLELRNWLSDERFAAAWLHNRAITKAEGRIKLAAELASRGIDRQIAAAALDDFFDEHSEETYCVRAFEKCRKVGKTRTQTEANLLRHGFPHRMIRKILLGEMPPSKMLSDENP